VKKVCGLIKKFLNVKQHYKLAKTEHPGWVKFAKRYLVCAVAFVFLGTFLTTWLEGSTDPIYKYEILSWVFLALLPLTPLFIFLLMYLAVIGTLLYGVFIFSPIWVPLMILSIRSEKKQLEEEKNLIAIYDARMQDKYRQIGIEQTKPENLAYVKAVDSVYFDGTKIVIKCQYNPTLVKSIKGLNRVTWNKTLLAWVCPVGEYSNVLGIAKRFNIPLHESLNNMNTVVEAQIDSTAPGTNARMLVLREKGAYSSKRHNTLRIDEGYVYLIRAMGENLYKIGKSTNPEKRVQSIIGGLPMKAEAIHIAWFEDHSYAEQMFHDTFSKTRKNGEWFILEDEDVEFIKSFGQNCDLNPTDEQLKDRARFEQKRKESYKKFKYREQRRNSQKFA
jgi:hypothetical protein